MALIDRPAQAVLDSELEALDRYWRAANYLSVGQIYLQDNPLLRRPLVLEHVKARLLGHWGTTPGLNFIYAHLNRIIRARQCEVLFVCGPGHGGPAVLANSWLEGSYSETYPGVTRDEEGMRRLFRQFSFPGGVPSHASPDTPGSIHEGGELGYSLAHAFGAALDNPSLVVACVVGDGEAETGPLAASWNSAAFLDPVHDGAVLPILHLNGYKIANPTVLGRKSDAAIAQMFEGLGYDPIFVTGDEPCEMHRLMAVALDEAFERIDQLQRDARAGCIGSPARWPMIVLRSPKGWTGPKEVDGKKVEGFWRAHQVPVGDTRENAAHRSILETWMRSYRADELFDHAGTPVDDLLAQVPPAALRMSASRHANAGTTWLTRPDWRAHAIAANDRGQNTAEATRVLGRYLADLLRLNADAANVRIIGPDETASNRLDAVFDVSPRVWQERIEPYDEHLSHTGRVMELLSEHVCQGWLEGYVLTGRHGLFSCYEAFTPIVASMFNQHAKWLKVARELEWRKPIPSFNYLLTSHVWRQDHNGFSHQDPGFIDHVVNKKADVVRVYLPPDANCLLRVADHCLETRDRINVIVAGKQPAPQWLSADEAEAHCAAGAGIWEWAGTERDGQGPQVVLACAGDVPTIEALAAAELLRDHIPSLRTRVVNVVDLMALQPQDSHPHGLCDAEFEGLFTRDCPIIFAHHGYPHLIHRLIYRRANHANFHVHGFIEEGATTTPFDMLVRNRLDRFHLACAAIDRAGVGEMAAASRQLFQARLNEHRHHIVRTGEDMPDIRDWRWNGAQGLRTSLDPAPALIATALNEDHRP